jgi:hypothetical protein
VLGSERDVTARWSKLYNEELRHFYASANIIRGIKSRVIK